MSSKPLVTVGLITYNRDKLIDKSIQSLLSQSYSNIELIISDDASADSTKKICKKYAKKDKRITYFQQKKNLGLAGNSNFVLEKARGKYFMWASDDDLWHKNFIKTLVNLLEKNEKAVLTMSNFFLFNETKKQYADYPFKKNLSGLECILTYLSHPSLLIWGMFRTKVLKAVGGFHTDDRPLFHKGSDHVTVFKILLRGDLIYENKVLFFKRDSGFALDRFKTLNKLHFSKEMRLRVFRYLTYPIAFSYDLFYLLKYNFLSNFRFDKKLLIAFYIFFWFFRVTIQFFFECLKGFYYTLAGIFK